jgi:dynein heavy chain
VLHTYNYAAALQHVGGQLRALSPAVAARVAPTLLEDAADYWERAVRAAVLEYRRCAPALRFRLVPAASVFVLVERVRVWGVG